MKSWLSTLSWLLLALMGAADGALVVIVDGIPADQLTKRVVQHAVDDVILIIACIAGGCCIIAVCLALCAHHNREGKHDKQAKPWEPSHSGPAPHSLDLVSTKEHGDDVPEAIRKLEANNDDAV